MFMRYVGECQQKSLKMSFDQIFVLDAKKIQKILADWFHLSVRIGESGTRELEICNDGPFKWLGWTKGAHWGMPGVHFCGASASLMMVLGDGGGGDDGGDITSKWSWCFNSSPWVSIPKMNPIDVTSYGRVCHTHSSIDLYNIVLQFSCSLPSFSYNFRVAIIPLHAFFPLVVRVSCCSVCFAAGLNGSSLMLWMERWRNQNSHQIPKSPR